MISEVQVAHAGGSVHDGAVDAGFLSGRVEMCHGVAGFVGYASCSNIKN